MKLILTIEFSQMFTRADLETYAERLTRQLSTVYKSTPGVSQEFVGITSKVEE